MEITDHSAFYRQLVQRYAENKASEEEMEVFFHLLREGKLDSWLTAAMDHDAGIETSRAPVPRMIRINRFFIHARKKIAVAAAILIFLTAGSYFLFFNDGKRTSSTTHHRLQEQRTNDIPAGRHKAILVLANGERISLDSVARGTLATQGNARVLGKDGRIQYEPADHPSGSGSEPVVYNTIITNKGETYSFTLADGSEVWLNSASSVRFPVIFTGNERRIEISGEAYFQVAKNAGQPFIVSVNGMDVRALGTEFNINAYSDEAYLLSTLVEGSIKVSKGGRQVIIRPGQQTQVNNRDNRIIINSNVDVSKVIAWKKGMFLFNDTDLPAIMRQISRWYDVEVVYENPVTTEKFGGGISRKLPLSQVLTLLEVNRIQFRIEGKKLFVRSMN